MNPTCYPTFRHSLLVLLCCLGLVSGSTQSLSIQSGMSADSVLNTLFGAGVTVSNVVLTCDTAVAMGRFQNGMSSIGLNDGIILSTGDIQSAVGPNSIGGTTGILGTPGDADLSSLMGGMSTMDACVISFDIASVCDTLVIQYVFASEEYPEFVGSPFNDVFGFFIAGPGYTGLHNMATIPATGQPVAINSVNAITNPNLFVDNTAGTGIEYDGFTLPMIAYAAVTPGATYQMKLGVADVSDQIYDSAVLLRREGVCANPGLVQLRIANQSHTTPVNLPGGTHQSIQLHQALSKDQATQVAITASGTAIEGVDYATLPDSVLIPADATTANFMIESLIACDMPGVRTLVLHYTDGSLTCSGSVYQDSITLQIEQTGVSPAVDAGLDMIVCSGESVQVGSMADPDYIYAWQSAAGISDTALAQPVFAGMAIDSVETVLLYLTATHPSGCTATDEVQVTIYPEVTIAGNLPDTFLLGEAILFDFLSVEYADNWAWDFGDGTVSSLALPTHTFTDTGSFEMELLATNGGGSLCEGRYTKTVYVSNALNTSLDTRLLPGAIRLSPNPATRLLELETAYPGYLDIHLFTATGKQVFAQSQIRQQARFDIQHLPAGLYFIRIQSEDGILTHKIQIERE